MSNTNTAVAETILTQIGGGRALAMTGGRAIAKDRGLVLKVKGSRRVNVVEIDLTDADDYTVTFRHFTIRKDKLVASFDGIHSDALKGLIEKETGLFLSL